MSKLSLGWRYFRVIFFVLLTLWFISLLQSIPYSIFTRISQDGENLSSYFPLFLRAFGEPLFLGVYFFLIPLLGLFYAIESALRKEITENVKGYILKRIITWTIISYLIFPFLLKLDDCGGGECTLGYFFIPFYMLGYLIFLVILGSVMSARIKNVNVEKINGEEPPRRLLQWNRFHYFFNKIPLICTIAIILSVPTYWADQTSCGLLIGLRQGIVYYSESSACLSQKAIEANDSSICDKAPINSQCYARVAIAFNNPDLCESVTNVDSTDLPRRDIESCYTSLVQAKKDESLCLKIEKPQRVHCYYALMRVTGDPSLCYKIEGNEEMQNTCLRESRYFENNPQTNKRPSSIY